MKKTLKSFAALISMVALLLTLVSCGGTQGTPAPDPAPSNGAAAGSETPEGSDKSEEPAEAPSDKKVSAETLSATAKDSYEIVVIEKNLTNPIWIALQEGAIQAGEDAGCKVTVLAPNTPESNEEQISLIQQQIARGVDGLVVIPADGTGIIPAIEEANAAGIPVINVDTKINREGGTCTVDTFIAVENYTAGVEAAKGLAEKMNGAGDLIILEGKPGTQSSIDIVGGANEVFAQYPDINIVASQAANWNRTDGYTVALNLLEANPDATAIFAANDEMAMGALQAVAQNGKEGQILIAGLNANPDAKEAVDNGQLALTFDKNGTLQGYSAVMAAVTVLNGDKVESAYEVPGLLYTK